MSALGHKRTCAMQVSAMYALPRKQTFARLDLRASPSVGLSGLIGPPDECRLVFPGHRISIWLTFEMRQLVRSWKCFGPTYIPGSRAGLASCAAPISLEGLS